MPGPTVPRIAIVYEAESIPLLMLANSATRCGYGLVWLADESDARILGRFGTVLTWADGSGGAIAGQLAELGVAGITTFADTQIERTATIAARLGLPANPPGAARCLVDKIAQRQALAAAGIPGPAFVGVSSPAAAERAGGALDALRYPVVVKPAVGFGGRDTVCLPDPESARAELTARFGAGQWQPAIVEECLGPYPPAAPGGFGDYLSVEAVVVAGAPSVVAVTGRMPLMAPFRETGAFLPAALPADEQAAAADMAIGAVRALGVHTGCLHIELKLTGAGPRVIEVNGRVPGGGIADLVLAHTGIDLYACALDAARGRRHGQALSTGPGVQYQLALQPPAGRLARLRSDWSERLDAIPGMSQVTVQSTEAKVEERDGSYGYLLMARGAAADHEALLDTYRRLYDALEPD